MTAAMARAAAERRRFFFFPMLFITVRIMCGVSACATVVLWLGLVTCCQSADMSCPRGHGFRVSGFGFRERGGVSALVMDADGSSGTTWSSVSGLELQRFRGGLVFKADRLLYHSTLDLRLTKKKKMDADGSSGTTFSRRIQFYSLMRCKLPSNTVRQHLFEKQRVYEPQICAVAPSHLLEEKAGEERV